jgi:hypothetical protein
MVGDGGEPLATLKNSLENVGNRERSSKNWRCYIEKMNETFIQVGLIDKNSPKDPSSSKKNHSRLAYVGLHENS